MDDFNERISKLVERHEALTVSIEHLVIESAKHDKQIEAMVKEQNRTVRELRLFQRYVLMMGLFRLGHIHL